MILVLVGAPGAGKGTQGDFLVERLAFSKLSTGDVLRAEIQGGSDLGLKVKDLVDSGQLVPDELLLSVIEQALVKAGSSGDVLLDGYPRNVAQAEALASLTGLQSVGAVVNLVVPKETLVHRLTGRRGCASCGAITHIDLLESADQQCGKCGGELFTRPDDAVERVSTRLEIFSRETAPVISYYRELGLCHNFDGDRQSSEIFDDIAELVDSLRRK